MILILTCEEDVTTDFVVQELGSAEFVRLNGDTFGRDSRIHCRYEQGTLSGEICVGSRRVAFGEIGAVYCRRLGMPMADPAIADEGVQEYARAELRALLDGLSALLDVRWMNHPHAVHQAESKLFQLAMAQRVGLLIPRTLVTNDGEVAKQFGASFSTSLVIKSLSSPRLMVSGDEHIMLTSRVATTDLETLGAMHLAPCIVQEEIVKRSDVRVTVVGDEAYAVELDSQSNPEASVDWRAVPEIAHERHVLPDSVRRASIDLCRMLNLSFGALDFALDRSGNYVFFEVNPNGQWAWLQLRTGVPIAKAIVGVLRGG